MASSPHIAPDNQRRLFVLRGVTLVATLAMSLLARPLFHILPSLPTLLGLCAVWAIFGVCAWLRLRRGVGEFELFVHLCADLAFLSAWLAFCGGTANPLTALYLLPVASAAALLRPPLAWASAAIAILAYSLLWIIAVPITVEDVDQAMRMHLTGMWLTFALSAALIASIVARMSLTLRERERHLAAARERLLRDERIVALGGLATGAAHALGTPLNTLTLLADELATTAAPGSAIAEDMKELRRQVERCRDIVNGLLDQAGAARAGESAQPLQEWLTHLVENLRQLRPEVAPVLKVDAAFAQQGAHVDLALGQAITNLLANAADAGAQSIFLKLEPHADKSPVAIVVLDDGAGFSGAALAHAGREPYSDKPQGMGLGLYLANAAAERLGGHMICTNVAGGAEVRLTLPAQALFKPS